MDPYKQEEDHTYDYIDSGAFSNYAYDGLSNDAYKFNTSSNPFGKSPLPKSRQKRCLIMFIIAAVVLIVIIAVVIGVVLRKNDKKDANDPKQFEASLTLSMTWISAYSDTNSMQYQRLTSDLLKQTEDALKQSDIGKNLDHITISKLRPGSVICDINIFMKTAKYSVNGASRDITTAVIQETVTDIVETAKTARPASILAKVDSLKIAVRNPESGTQSGSGLTTVPPYISSTSRQTSLPMTASTTRLFSTTSRQTPSPVTPSPATPSPATTSTTKLYSTTSRLTPSPVTIFTTRRHSTTTAAKVTGEDPCTNATYLETILMSKCFNISKYYQAIQSTDASAETCKFLHETVRCVINEVFLETGSTCTVDVNDQVLADNADYIKSIISIDPRTCFLSTTSETPPPTRYPPQDTTTIVIDTRSPCTNSSYLEELLLRQCVDYIRFAEVIQADITEKCKFIVDVIDCVLRKVFEETGATCTTAQKDAVIAENAGTVQQLLYMDIMTCFP